MKKTILLGIVLLMLLPIAFAENKVCYENKECNFATVVYNTTQNYYDATTVTNTLKHTNGSIIYQDQAMQEVTIGGETFWAYNYTINQSGTYIRTSVIDSLYLADEEINVLPISNEDNAGLILSNSITLYLILLLVIIALIAYIILKK